MKIGEETALGTGTDRGGDHDYHRSNSIINDSDSGIQLKSRSVE
jgi:hypothetical protein